MTEKLSLESAGEKLGNLVETAARALKSKKGENLVLLDVREMSYLTDFHLIASGRNMPQLKALAAEVARAVKGVRGKPTRKSGTPESGWEIIDAGDLVVHVFDAEHREYYRLEELWNDAERYELE